MILSSLFKVYGAWLRLVAGARSFWLWWRHPDVWWSEHYAVHEPSMLEQLRVSDWRREG